MTRIDSKPGTTFPIDENPNAGRCFVCQSPDCKCAEIEGEAMSGVTEIQQHLAAEAKLKAEIKKKDRVIQRMKKAALSIVRWDGGCPPGEIQGICHFTGCGECFATAVKTTLDEAEADDGST